MEKKILPLTEPLIATYQGNSFVLGVLLSHENVKNAYLNGYYNLQCHRTNDSFKSNIDFCNALWEDFRLSGIAEMDLYHVCNIAKEKFSGFIKERIDQDNYILFYYVDVYYLPHSRFYNTHHDIHDLYVFGYEDDCLWAYAYSDKNNKMQKIKVLISDVIKGLYVLEDRLDFCSFRVNHKADVKVDRSEIVSQIKNYLAATTRILEPEMIYGVGVYDAVLSILKKELEREGNFIKSGMTNAQQVICNREEVIDMRVFRALYDHKLVLKDHLTTLFGGTPEYQEITDEAEKIEFMAKEMFYQMIKYCMTGKKSLIEHVMKLNCCIRDEEGAMLKKVIEIL